MATTQRQWLNVPYTEKEAAKARGARWDPEARRWYASVGGELRLLARWLPVPLDGEPVPVRLAALSEGCPCCGQLRSAVLGILVPTHLSEGLVGIPTLAGDELFVEFDECASLLAEAVPSDIWSNHNLSVVTGRGGRLVNACVHCRGQWGGADLVEAIADLDADGIEVAQLAALTVEVPLAALHWLALGQDDTWDGDGVDA